MNLEQLKEKHGARVSKRWESIIIVNNKGDTYCGETAICEMVDDIIKALDCMNQPTYGDQEAKIDHYGDAKQILERIIK